MAKTRSTQTRREFLGTLAGATAASIAAPAWLRAAGPTTADAADPRVAELVRRTVGIDMHNHVDVPLSAGAIPGPAIDLAGEVRRSGLSAICMTFAVDYQPLTAPGQAFDRFQNGLAAMDADLAKNHIRRALNLNDLRAAHDAGEPVVIQAVEGGHFIEGHVDRVGAAYQRGLRVLGLTHDHDAEPPLGDIYTAPAHMGGLTPLGADVIRACDRLGIDVDLTHCGEATVAAAMNVSTRPMLFSHTGLDTQLGADRFMAQMMRSRLIRKEHAKAMAGAGAVIGVWTHLADSTADYVRNLKAMVDVVGVDHVGIGTDTKLTPPYDGGPGRPASRPAGNRGGPGRGRRGGPQIGGRTNQAWPDVKAGFYNAVVGEMLNQGFTPEEIGKIGGGNFCRVFDAVTAGRGQ